MKIPSHNRDKFYINMKTWNGIWTVFLRLNLDTTSIRHKGLKSVKEFSLSMEYSEHTKNNDTYLLIISQAEQKSVVVDDSRKKDTI